MVTHCDPVQEKFKVNKYLSSSFCLIYFYFIVSSKKHPFFYLRDFFFFHSCSLCPEVCLFL